MGTHSTRYPAEVGERAVRLVLDQPGEHGSISSLSMASRLARSDSLAGSRRLATWS